MKSWMTSVAMTVGIFAVVVMVILAMSAQTLFTLAVLFKYEETSGEALVLLVSIWLVLASCLVGGFTLFAGKDSPWRRGALVGSAMCLLLSVLGGGLATYTLGTREYRPIDTTAMARHWLERFLKQRAISSPNEFKIVDLEKQIRNIRVQGPQMSFEPKTARYIEFEFDTGCGEVILLTAMTGSGEGDNLPPIGSSCAR